MRFFVVLCFFHVSVALVAQNITILGILPEEISECSGLTYISSRLLSHEDSGNEAALFEIDTVTAEISRKVIIENATQVDWEDIAADDSHLYIGDFGNNNGSRQDLKIYKVSIEEYISAENDTVSSEIITFSYSEQESFDPSPFNTNFDAEAMISLGDSLYIFTKNWQNFKTYIYALPKLPGDYSLARTDSLNPMGLITGATFNAMTYELVLTGYSLFLSPFSYRVSNFSEAQFSEGSTVTETLIYDETYSGQVEGISSSGNFNYFICAETSFTGEPFLGSFELTGSTSQTEESKLLAPIAPNPAWEKVRVEVNFFNRLEVYSSHGTLQLTTHLREFDVSSWAPGMYYLKIFGDTAYVSSKLIVLKNEFR